MAGRAERTGEGNVIRPTGVTHEGSSRTEDASALRLSRNAITVLENRYLDRDDEGNVVETPDGLFRRVAHAVAGCEAKWGVSEKARQERIQGLVILRLVIDQTGEVTEVDVLKGLPYGLTESAIETVEGWEFEPALHDGKPVSVLYNITINFRLQKEKKPEA